MKHHLIPGFTALGCLALASCYPYPEPPRRDDRPPANSVTSPEQQKLQEQRDKMKEKELQNGATLPSDATPGMTPADNTPRPPSEAKRTEYQVADPVPGRPGFVLSPYNKKIVDVRDIPAGTLVQDPTYPAEQKKYFRVP